MRYDPEKPLAGQDAFGWIGLKIRGFQGVVADTPVLSLLTTYLEKTFICDTEEEARGEARILAEESGYSDLYYWVDYWIPDTSTPTPPAFLVKP